MPSFHLLALQPIVCEPVTCINRLGVAVSGYGPFTWPASGPWNNISGKYLALKIQVGTNIYYGWIKLGVAIGPYSVSITIIEYAYNSISNQAILAGEANTTGIAQDGELLSLSFAPPSPNPARGEAALRYTLSRAGHVRLSVFDAAGRRVAIVHDGEQAAGAHAASFTMDDAAGRELSSGLYLVRLEAEGHVITRRLAKVR